MEDRHVTEYCPRCQAVQPTFQFTEDARLVRRCQACGFPVESGLVLERSDAVGTPSPPEVKILCVDDDPLVIQLIGDILRFRGYTVLTANDGPSGLEMAIRQRPSLVLLDVMMPGMDGFEVCLRLKADPDLKPIPVIILTAKSDATVSARAFEVGAQLVLQKPAPTAAVLRTIEAALALASRQPVEPALDVAEAASAHAPEEEPDLSVPTRPVPFRVWTVDDATVEARVYLRLDAEGHAGPETLQDRLNDPDLFLTLSVDADPPVVFLNKIQVIRAEVTEEAPAQEEDSVGVSIERVTVQLISGEQLAGTVRIEGRAGMCRLSDFLNTQPAFLPLRGTDRLHLLHKRFIVRVIPQRS
jgi:CheY-like chemotaxis protein